MIISKSQRKILNAAKTIYIQKGYEGTSMNAIAEAVGIRKASLYAHFNGKEALFRLMFTEIMQEHIHALKEIFRALSGDSVRNDLYYLISRYVKYCYVTPEIDVWTRCYYFPPEPLKQWLQDSTHKIEIILRKKITAIITRGQEQGIIRTYPANHLMKPFYHFMLGYVLSYTEYDFDAIEKDLLLGFKLLWMGISMNEEKE